MNARLECQLNPYNAPCHTKVPADSMGGPICHLASGATGYTTERDFVIDGG